MVASPNMQWQILGALWVRGEVYGTTFGESNQHYNEYTRFETYEIVAALSLIPFNRVSISKMWGRLNEMERDIGDSADQRGSTPR